MELLEAVQKRHSVRMYQDREIPDSIKKELLDFIIGQVWWRRKKLPKCRYFSSY